MKIRGRALRDAALLMQSIVCCLAQSRSITGKNRDACGRSASAISEKIQLRMWPLFQALAARIIHTLVGAIARNVFIPPLFSVCELPMNTCGMRGCISGSSQMIATCVKLARVAPRRTSCLTSSAPRRLRTRTLPESSPFHKQTLVSSRFRRRSTLSAGQRLAW